MTFIFDRSHCSSAEVSPVIYQRETKHLAAILQIKLLFNEEINERALVTPTAVLVPRFQCLCGRPSLGPAGLL